MYWKHVYIYHSFPFLEKGVQRNKLFPWKNIFFSPAWLCITFTNSIWMTDDYDNYKFQHEKDAFCLQNHDYFLSCRYFQLWTLILHESWTWRLFTKNIVLRQCHLEGHWKIETNMFPKYLSSPKQFIFVSL